MLYPDQQPTCVLLSRLQGFPESVAPQYAPYMFWRGVQYLFGGAMSVFTTTSLMAALGVAGKYGGEASAAINWWVG